ncbi:MAG: 50S ribosomal protein L18 [Candidatus Nitrosocosmicus sp.]
MSYIKTLKSIRNNKTNYRKRKALLIGRRNFITIKTSNEHIHCQLIKPSLKGDIVLAFSNSKELAKHGWKGSSNNLSASFLVGLLLGKKMQGKNNNSAVLYTGKTTFTSKVAACLKGIAASGVDIPLSEDSLPSDDRINSSHVSEYASSLKNDQNLYEKRFSKLLKNDLSPEDYPTHFEDVKNKILSSDFA